MIGLLFSFALVGVPALVGTYLVTNPASERDPSAGIGLLVYAVTFVVIYYFWNPEGKIVFANYQLKMPLALVVSATIGLLLGRARR